jgi:hypothetical protein
MEKIIKLIGNELFKYDSSFYYLSFYKKNKINIF